jgi:hypothetical protein
MTTKAKRAAVIPLVPLLADALRSAKTRGVDFSGKVFPRGLPSVVTLARDLAACGIEPENEQGRVDFHATAPHLREHPRQRRRFRVGASEARGSQRMAPDRPLHRSREPSALRGDGEIRVRATVLNTVPYFWEKGSKNGKSCPNGHYRRRRQDHPNCFGISGVVQSCPKLGKRRYGAQGDSNPHLRILHLLDTSSEQKDIRKHQKTAAAVTTLVATDFLRNSEVTHGRITQKRPFSVLVCLLLAS